MSKILDLTSKTLGEIEAIWEKTIRESNSSQNRAKISKSVSKIISTVQKKGDTALINYAKKFDKTKITNFKFTEAEVNLAFKNADKKLVKSLETSLKRIEYYHQKQLPKMEVRFKDKLGIELGYRYTPIEKVCLYVPGGKYSYPSSVLMNAVPAIVAGVKNLFLTTPVRNNLPSNVVLVAAKVAGIKDIYKLGGVQAIAGFAYGTKSIPKVDLICGPGNAFVTEAKRQVFGDVGIDIIAGPSEVLIISDGCGDAKFVAVDLLSQAEHDEMARSILITTSKKFAHSVEEQVSTLLNQYDKRKIATNAWAKNGRIFLVNSLEKASYLANIIAPEHLEIILEEKSKKLGKDISNAGAIFYGDYTPEAFGDYLAGPSHVLPTSGTARFFSGISVFTFLKRSSLIKASKKGFTILTDDIISLAEEEGLVFHALSAKLRKK
ncbi:MAG: histidinol dehydrogenase [Alphaproteobacteria bacterium]|jgi:histidinol dehydrogenase